MKTPPDHLEHQYIYEKTHPKRWSLFYGETKMEKQRQFLCWFEKEYPEWVAKNRMAIDRMPIERWKAKCEREDLKESKRLLDSISLAKKTVADHNRVNPNPIEE